jgi:hypothetical protein
LGAILEQACGAAAGAGTAERLDGIQGHWYHCRLWIQDRRLAAVAQEQGLAMREALPA